MSSTVQYLHLSAMVLYTIVSTIDIWHNNDNGTFRAWFYEKMKFDAGQW